MSTEKKFRIQSHELDIEKAIDNTGGNRFNFIVLASAKAREIANRRNLVLRNDSTVEFDTRTITQAIHEIETKNDDLDIKSPSEQKDFNK